MASQTVETKEFDELCQSTKSKQRFSYDEIKNNATFIESRGPSYLNDRLTKLSSSFDVNDMLPVEFFNRDKFRKAVRDKASRSSSSKQASSGINEKEKETPTLGKR